MILVPSRRLRQPQEVPKVVDGARLGLRGMWLPLLGVANLAGGLPLAPAATGAPTTRAASPGMAWNNSGLSLGGTSGPGWNTQIGWDAAASNNFSLLVLFQSPDTPGSGYGSLFQTPWMSLGYHHTVSQYQNAAGVYDGVWTPAKFATPQANKLTCWVCTYDRQNLKAYTDGVLTTSAVKTGAPSVGGSLHLMARSDGYEWNGSVFIAAHWNRALSADEAREYGSNPWKLFEPARRPSFYSLSGGDPLSGPIRSFLMRRSGLSRIWR